MKILFDNLSQPRKYADSYGWCLVEVEDGEDVENIKAEFHKPKEWYQEKYTFDKELTEYVLERYNGPVTYTGKLLLFRTHQVYLD